ncbi:MAG: hypothetical protein ACYSWU_08435, partial [Planctomycetota bacterium]
MDKIDYGCQIAVFSGISQMIGGWMQELPARSRITSTGGCREIRITEAKPTAVFAVYVTVRRFNQAFEFPFTELRRERWCAEYYPVC